MASSLQPFADPQPNKSMANGSLTLSTQFPLDTKWERLCDEIKAMVAICKWQSFQLNHLRQTDSVNMMERIHEITKIVVSCSLQSVHYISTSMFV